MDKNLWGRFLLVVKKLWSSNSQSIVGVDIGSSSIKIVQLRKEKEQAVLETYGELSVGSYAGLSVGQVVQLSEEGAIKMMKDLIKEAGITANRAVIGVSLRNSFVTTIKVPLVKDKSMAEVVQLEARKYIPAPLGEIEMNWQILSRPDDGGEKKKENVLPLVEILLVAIYKEVIQKYQKILDKSGFKTKFFEIEVFSMWRSSLFRPTAPVLLIDLGASTTKMSVVDGGLLRASHTIDRGAQSITNAIAKSLNITFERAEEMKMQLGLSPRPEYKELRNIIESALNIILSDGKHFMLSYRRKYGQSVGQAVLAGGGALLGGMVDTAVKILGIEVIFSDPFSKTSYPAFLQDTLKETGPIFSTAVGLALKKL